LLSPTTGGGDTSEGNAGSCSYLLDSDCDRVLYIYYDLALLGDYYFGDLTSLTGTWVPLIEHTSVSTLKIFGRTCGFSFNIDARTG
jgi:hypothetical protein